MMPPTPVANPASRDIASGRITGVPAVPPLRELLTLVLSAASVSDADACVVH